MNRDQDFDAFMQMMMLMMSRPTGPGYESGLTHEQELVQHRLLEQKHDKEDEEDQQARWRGEEPKIHKHCHRCPACHTVWEHADTMMGNEEAHRCPKCHTLQWVQYVKMPEDALWTPEVSKELPECTPATCQAWTPPPAPTKKKRTRKPRKKVEHAMS